MTTALDSNIIISALDKSETLQGPVARALERAGQESLLIICAPVYAEVLAFPQRSQSQLDSFLAGTDIGVDWEFDEDLWLTAALAYRAHAQRRRTSGAGHPRRILADFLIGAHALVNGYTLLTLDQRHYRNAFPKLKLQKI
jgi:predicted nucleic acid-binding protein